MELKVVNDKTEHGIALLQSYNSVLVKYEDLEGKSFIKIVYI